MEVRFRSRALLDAYQDQRIAIIEWGQRVGDRYRERVDLMASLAVAKDLYSAPQLHFHPLVGDRAGQFAVYLTGLYRLIVTFEDGAVVVEEVSAHYGD